MRIRVCWYKNAGVAGYAEAFRPVQSDSQTSEWYSYFENDVLVQRKLSFCYIGAADKNQTSQYGSYLIFDVLDTRYAGENLRRSHISITDHSVTSNVFLLTSV